MRTSYFVVFASSILFSFSGLTGAADMKDMKGMDMSKPTMVQAQGVGVIKGIDPQAGTLIVAHEPIKAFEWSSMTMKFKVADLAIVKNVAVGNKVRFTIQGKDMMKSTVTALEKAD